MPELPEVQTVVDALHAEGIVGLHIIGVDVRRARNVAGVRAVVFARRLRGRTIAAVQRRGKFIVMPLDDGTALLTHLRMSGQLIWRQPTEPCDPHDRVSITFTNGRQLRFHDTRAFGRMHLVADPREILGHLGPEPLGPAFTVKTLADVLRTRARMLKPLLLDQTQIAGIGNIYADEALWLARLHPRRVSNTLRDTEIGALYRAIRHVLRKGIRNLGTRLGGGEPNFTLPGTGRSRNHERLHVFRRTGQACSRCGTAVQRMIVAQRGTHICPQCQLEPCT
jgi:formamidopyrimidine-DNA glycosylase